LELIDLAWVDDGMKRHWLHSNCNLNLVLFSWVVPAIALLFTAFPIEKIGVP
jgi:hypothetical protein